MDLFASSGMIVSTSGGKGAQKRLALRLPHTPLFNRKTVDKALETTAIDIQPVAKKARSVANIFKSQPKSSQIFAKPICII